jgi:hypothetical protein
MAVLSDAKKEQNFHCQRRYHEMKSKNWKCTAQIGEETESKEEEIELHW